MKIALTFSGGGFRASAFSLGAISLLAKINYGQSTLLDQVHVLSTVSGGTITGARYALGRKRNETFIEIYDHLYQFMANSSLVSQALERLAVEEGWEQQRTRNLITAFADIYDRDLFGGARFGQLMADPAPGMPAHLSFNATEFNNARQFRFQWSERITDPEPGEHERGIIGNQSYKIPDDVAKDIRLADIMAASSCFPGGFEPVNFPDDFIWSADPKPQLVHGEYPVGLMDGGIVDNQGIEPVLLAETRMKKNVPEDADGNKPTQTDLVIVCEVASPYIKRFQANQQHRDACWKEMSPKGVAFWNAIALLILLGLGVWCFKNDHRAGLVIVTVLSTLSALVFALFKIINYFARRSGIPAEFLQPLGKLLRLPLYVYENLIANRYRSVLMLTMNVFLKHVRKMNYDKLYEQKEFSNRRVMNAIYELRAKESVFEKKVANGKIRKEMIPTKVIQKNSELASSMGTTLWFTKEELVDQKMLDAIIACGQYTMCWNLLEYIHKLKGNAKNTNETHRQLMACEDQLMTYWREFKHNPKFLLPVKGRQY